MAALLQLSPVALATAGPLLADRAWCAAAQLARRDALELLRRLPPPRPLPCMQPDENMPPTQDPWLAAIQLAILAPDRDWLDRLWRAVLEVGPPPSAPADWPGLRCTTVASDAEGWDERTVADEPPLPPGWEPYLIPDATRDARTLSPAPNPLARWRWLEPLCEALLHCSDSDRRTLWEAWMDRLAYHDPALPGQVWRRLTPPLAERLAEPAPRPARTAATAGDAWLTEAEAAALLGYRNSNSLRNLRPQLLELDPACAMRRGRRWLYRADRLRALRQQHPHFRSPARWRRERGGA